MVITPRTAVRRKRRRDGRREPLLVIDPTLDAAAEELVAEMTAYSVCASSGIDPGEYSISYLASWSEHTPIATIERAAALIDRLSRRIEDAVASPSTSPSASTTPPRG